MEFKEWIGNQNSIIQEVDRTLKLWKQQILASIKQENGRILLKFPKNIELSSLPRQNTSAATNLMNIAAWTEYEGNKIQEADEDWERRHDKGWTAYKALQNISPTGWDKRQQYRFKANLTYSVKDIASALGFLFEIDVFLYLRDVKKFKDGDDDAMGVGEKRKIHEEIIANRTGTARDLIFQMIAIHVKDLSEQIIKRTERILGCADIVWFQGGNTGKWQGRENPADIIIGCSSGDPNHDRVGYSIKFGSETRISIAQLTLPSIVHVLTKKTIPSQVRKLTNIAQDKEWSLNVINELKKMMDRYKNNPKAFVELLNELLSGGWHTFPAVRNYASVDGGGAEWSLNFQKDFVASDDIKKPLLARRDATVDITSNQTYVKLTYKVPGGSFNGTSLFFIPKSGKIDIRVTNLTSSRR